MVKTTKTNANNDNFTGMIIKKNKTSEKLQL